MRYNSRGVGKSSGWPSFTGFSEAKDLEAVVAWLMQKITNVNTVSIVVRALLVVSDAPYSKVNQRATRMERL